MAVGYDGKIAYSPDAINWTLVSDSKFSTSHINDVCYGNGKFVAVSDGDRIGYCT